MIYENIVFDFINDAVLLVFPEFEKKIYFSHEVINQAEKPYILLSEINDEVIHRSYENEGDITEFRRATLTIRVNVNGVERGNSNNSENKYLAKEVRDYIRALLSRDEAVDFFLRNEMSNRYDLMSPNRDRNTSVSGGFMYSYEFDIPFDYKVVTGFEVFVAEKINLEVENKNDNSKIEFEV